MRPKLKHVSEEIVRWAFEVSVQKGRHWKIAFTNPTAGPWKRVMALDQMGRSGEVHRFEIDEKRPDLILFSDKFKTVLIIEAKTDLKGLADKAQIAKTAELFRRLTALLKSVSQNPFWGERAEYEYRLGLLWGRQTESKAEVLHVVAQFKKALNFEATDILCIQGQLIEGHLQHKVYWGISGKEFPIDSYQR